MQLPPPFLSKTYDLVDDPESDDIVAWAPDGESFIVKKNDLFASQILPKMFKHNNFSSFVRQLNTYGFKKVDPDHWRFANEHFLRGQKHLLHYIGRKRAQPGGSNENTRFHPAANPAIEVGAYGDLKDEVDALKRDRSYLAKEVVRMRRRAQAVEENMQAMQQQINHSTQMNQQLFQFLDKAMKNPSFLQQVLHAHASANHSSEYLTNGRKKRRASVFESSDGNLPRNGEEATDNTGALMPYQPSISEFDLLAALGGMQANQNGPTWHTDPISAKNGLAEVNHAFDGMQINHQDVSNRLPNIPPLKTEVYDDPMDEGLANGNGHTFQEVSPSQSQSERDSSVLANARNEASDARSHYNNSLEQTVAMYDNQPYPVETEPVGDFAIPEDESWMDYLTDRPSDDFLPSMPPDFPQYAQPGNPVPLQLRRMDGN